MITFVAYYCETIFLSETGIDDPNCGNSSNPCRTILYATQSTTNTNITFVFYSGTYSNDFIFLNQTSFSFIALENATVQIYNTSFTTISGNNSFSGIEFICNANALVIEDGEVSKKYSRNNVHKRQNLNLVNSVQWQNQQQKMPLS